MLRHQNINEGESSNNNTETGGVTNKGFEDDDSHAQNGHHKSSNQSKVEEQPIDTSEPERQVWENPIEFLFSCISLSVGLGNIWRFPYTAYLNGGGAFIIPYLIVLFLIGKPLYYLELAVGQFSSYGQVKVWKMSPFFKGVGYGSLFGSCCVLSYYCALMAITVFYMVASFSSVLPWSQCDENWENVTCNENKTLATGFYENTSLPQLYFQKEVLKQKEDIDDGIGYPDWRLSLCLLFSWILIFLSVCKGVKSSGKVAYFTALFPYSVLIILLIRGATLPGAADGIFYFINPQWEKLWDPNVWFAAVSQCFFSLTVGFGPIIMFSSHNKFKHNVYRDAMIISVMDTVTSILAGVTVFSILGNLAHELQVPIDKVASGGPNLAFVSYPDAISKFEFVPQFFAVMFFLMLFTLGIGSATSLAKAIITVISDKYTQIKEYKLAFVVSLIGFLSGLVYLTPGGFWIFSLVDHFGGDFVIYAMALLEIIGISWGYGVNNICRDIQFMLDRNVSFYWRICWGFIIPVGLSVILVYRIINEETLQFDGKDYPVIAIVIGWVIAGFAVGLIPLTSIHSIWKANGENLWDKIANSFKPREDWGPKAKQINEEWKEYIKNPQPTDMGMDALRITKFKNHNNGEIYT